MSVQPVRVTQLGSIPAGLLGLAAVLVAVLAFGGPATFLSESVLKRGCKGLRASQARDYSSNRYGPIDRIGAACTATIGHCQCELLDR